MQTLNLDATLTDEMVAKGVLLVVLEAFGISENQYTYLVGISRKEGQSMKIFGQQFGLKFSRLTSAVDVLEEELGLVKRKPSKDDRRVVNLSITNKGKNLLLKIAHVIEQAKEKVAPEVAVFF
jgi:DNA-binding MarR family transcriptional regulator